MDARKPWALLRDRHGLAALFVMPVIFILVMTMALTTPSCPALRLMSATPSSISTAAPIQQSLARRLNKTGSSGLVDTVAQADTARQAIRESRYALALVLPQGFGERLLALAGPTGSRPSR